MRVVPKEPHPSQMTMNPPVDQVSVPSFQRPSQTVETQSLLVARRKAMPNKNFTQERVQAHLRNLLVESRLETIKVNLQPMTNIKTIFHYEDKNLTLDSPFYLATIEGEVVWPFPSNGDGKGRPKGKKLELAISVEDGRIVAAQMKGDK